MNLVQALHYGRKTTGWLMPDCERIEIAGSIRRERPVCNDIDIVCIPATSEEKDLLGNIISNKNHVFDFIIEYLLKTPEAKLISGNPHGKQMIVQLPKCQLDIWFADETTFATRLLCRTGSAEHNTWLASRAKRQGKKWNPYEGILYGGRWRSASGGDEVYDGGTLLRFTSEADIYASFDLPFIEPRDRELSHLIKTYGQ